MIRRLILSAFMHISVPLFLHAQLHWKKADSLFDPLPSSFHVFKSNDTLDGFPFVGYYVSVALKDKSLSFSTQSTEGKAFTPDQYFGQEDSPLLVVNGPFFSFETNHNLSLIIRNGKIVSHNVLSLRGIEEDTLYFYYPTRSAIGIDRKRKADVAWVFTDSLRRRPYAFENAPVIAKGNDAVPSIYDLGDVNWRWWEMRTAIGGGPTLVHDGKIWITNKEEQMFTGEVHEKGPRTAMGYTNDNRLIILVIEGRLPGAAAGADLEQEARILKNLGCLEALNLDGGGSSCMLINGKETIRPADESKQRPLPAVFLIKWKGKK
ncbi:MAG: phosphodiester glycosidase family protein [Chitinophagales bacterium]